MWSFYAPGANPCAPNTDVLSHIRTLIAFVSSLAYALCSQRQVTDCGWRMPKRMARLTVARSDTCETTCELTEDCGGCNDMTDDVASRNMPPGYRITSERNLTTCGRGTQARRCELHANAQITAEVERQVAAYEVARANDLFLDQYATPTGEPGGSAYHDHRYHERAIYVQGSTIGQSSCTPPDNVALNVPKSIWSNSAASNIEFDTSGTSWYEFVGETNVAARVCSDGGEGSVRVPLHVPTQSYFDDHNLNHNAHALVHYDFICPYGSQPGVCPDRDLTLFQAARDELEQPSGPKFSDCTRDDVPDFE